MNCFFTYPTGVLLGCYARYGRVHEIVTNSILGNGLLKLPKLHLQIDKDFRESILTTVHPPVLYTCYHKIEIPYRLQKKT